MRLVHNFFDMILIGMQKLGSFLCEMCIYHFYKNKREQLGMFSLMGRKIRARGKPSGYAGDLNVLIQCREVAGLDKNIHQVV